MEAAHGSCPWDGHWGIRTLRVSSAVGNRELNMVMTDTVGNLFLTESKRIWRRAGETSMEAPPASGDPASGSPAALCCALSLFLPGA